MAVRTREARHRVRRTRPRAGRAPSPRRRDEAKTPAACPAAKDLDGLRRQLGGIERRIDVLRRNRQAIKACLRAWEDAGAATPTAADGVPGPVAEDGGS